MSHPTNRIVDKCELEGEPYQVAVLLDKPAMMIAKAWFASDFAVGLNFLLAETRSARCTSSTTTAGSARATPSLPSPAAAPTLRSSAPC